MATEGLSLQFMAAKLIQFQLAISKQGLRKAALTELVTEHATLLAGANTPLPHI